MRMLSDLNVRRRYCQSDWFIICFAQLLSRILFYSVFWFHAPVNVFPRVQIFDGDKKFHPPRKSHQSESWGWADSDNDHLSVNPSPTSTKFTLSESLLSDRGMVPESCVLSPVPPTGTCNYILKAY